MTQRLRGDGYAVASEPQVTGDGYYEGCVAGPEGLLVELTVSEKELYITAKAVIYSSFCSNEGHETAGWHQT